MKRLGIVVLALLAGGALSPAWPQASLLVSQAEVPIYPSVALAAGLGGTVRVKVTVRNGVVTDLNVLPSDQRTSEAFVAATLKSLRSWKFADGVDTTFASLFVYRMARGLSDHPVNPRVEMQLPTFVRLTGQRSKPFVFRDPSPSISKPPSGPSSRRTG